MTDATDKPEKGEAGDLSLRARPQPVTRLNRNALMVAGGGAALLIFAAMSIALRPPRAIGAASPRELYNFETRPPRKVWKRSRNPTLTLSRNSARRSPAISARLY